MVIDIGSTTLSQLTLQLNLPASISWEVIDLSETPRGGPGLTPWAPGSDSLARRSVWSWGTPGNFIHCLGQEFQTFCGDPDM